MGSGGLAQTLMQAFGPGPQQAGRGSPGIIGFSERFRPGRGRSCSERWTGVCPEVREAGTSVARLFGATLKGERT
jgi:hypothetical protein